MKEQIGRVCVKTIGREAGRKCVIVDVLDRNFVRVTGPRAVTGLRRRRLNISHLSFLPHRLDIRKDATDAVITKALGKTGLTDYMRKNISIHLMGPDIGGSAER